jgi:predicted ABC-type ATPase
MNPADPDAVASQAAREALRERAEALAKGADFSIETTLSGNSELRLTMTYIALDSPDTNVLRVNLRADNSARSFADVAIIEHGRIITMADGIRGWVERALAAPLEPARLRATDRE